MHKQYIRPAWVAEVVKVRRENTLSYWLGVEVTLEEVVAKSGLTVHLVRMWGEYHGPFDTFEDASAWARKQAHAHLDYLEDTGQPMPYDH